jgi:F-type H+-transporting ATPase subunit delta
MSQVTIGSRYAQAFLGAAGSTGEADALAHLVEDAAKAYADSAELRAVLTSPVVPIGQREAVLAQVLSALGGLSLGGGDLARRSLLVMLRRGRISALPETARALRGLVDEAQGVLRGEVVTARQMAESFYSDLERALSARHGRKVILGRRIDATLVGGVVTRVDGQTMDQSVRGQLGRMQRELLASIDKLGAAAPSA